MGDQAREWGTGSTHTRARNLNAPCDLLAMAWDEVRRLRAIIGSFEDCDDEGLKMYAVVRAGPDGLGFARRSPEQLGWDDDARRGTIRRCKGPAGRVTPVPRCREERREIRPCPSSQQQTAASCNSPTGS